MLILPLQFIAMLPFPRLLRRSSRASRAAGSIATGNVEEGMSNVLAVQSLGGNQRERRRFSAHSAESFKRFRAEVLVRILYGVANGAARGLLGLVAFYFISSRVIEGVLTPGDYGVLFYYYAWLSGALTAIPYVWIRIQQDVPGIRRVFFLMDLPSEAARAGAALPSVRRGIEFAGVGFTYPDGREALRDVNLALRAGQVTALVGPTGAGKTSLAYLVPAFHDPTVGAVRVDGRDLRDSPCPVCARSSRPSNRATGPASVAGADRGTVRRLLPCTFATEATGGLAPDPLERMAGAARYGEVRAGHPRHVRAVPPSERLTILERGLPA